MADFTPIETQEAFDAAIKNRLERERETVAKQYEGFLSKDEVTASTSKLEEKIATLEAEKRTFTASMAEKDKQLAKYESDSVKTRIAHEEGLSYDAIQFLKGTTEEEITKSAQALKSIMGDTKTKSAPPLANPDTGSGADNPDAALLKMIQNLETKGE